MLFNPSPVTPRRSLRSEWLPVLCAMIFICFTSTSFMGGGTTQKLVNAVWQVLLGHWHWDLTGPVNEACRKTGHFFGYGIIGLIFSNAWYKSAQAFAWVVRSWLTPFAATLAVVSTFFVACLDEWHQRFLPGRVGSMRDALLDAAGAIFLNLLIWAFRARRRRNALNNWKRVKGMIA
ncbi:MAG TPA: VanZ family protein [Acidobacteriaceae bacterium]